MLLHQQNIRNLGKIKKKKNFKGGPSMYVTWTAILQCNG